MTDGEWTISTLKQYFESRLHATEEHCEAKLAALGALHVKDVELLQERLKANALALTLKAEENRQHFESLNGEQARIAKVLEMSVPREVYEEFRENDRKWKADTDKVLTLKTGQSKGMAQLWGFAATAVFVLAGLFAVAAYFKG